MGLEKVIGKLIPLFLAGSISFSNCGKGDECQSDVDCPEEKICNNGSCQNAEGKCETDWDCGGDQVCENYQCIGSSSLPGVPATTKILDDEAAGYLMSVSSDKNTIAFSSASAYAKSLKAGDVIAAGIYALTPEGLLRKVTSKSDNGQTITLSTVPANLEQALEEGSLSAQMVLTPGYLEMASPLMEGVALGVKEAPLSADFSNSQSLTINFENTDLYKGNVFLDGRLVLSSEMGLELKISSSQVEHVKFTMEGSENLELRLYGEFSESINKKLPPFKPVKFAPIMFMAGYVPVVIVPDLNITLGILANGSLSVETSITQSKSAEYGLEYKNQQWNSFKDIEDSFDFNLPTFSNTQAYAKAYANVEMEFNLYGVAGPVAGAEAYVEATVAPLAELWYVLTAGAKVYAGIEVGEMGSKSLIDYEIILFEKKVVLDEGHKEKTEPCQDKCSFIDEKECSGETGWLLCGDYNNDGCLEWSGKFSCNPDEYCNQGECAAKSCASGEWQCADGACIPTAWHCDGGNDCAGGEDESGCGCLGTNECVFSGAKGCFDAGWKECGDFNGDGCLEWGKYHTCKADEKCSWLSGICVSIKPEVECSDVWWCDEADEKFPSMCVPDSYICKGECLPKSYFCDGLKDCSQGLDEDNCCGLYTKKACKGNVLKNVDDCGDSLSWDNGVDCSNKICIEYDQTAGCLENVCKNGDVYFYGSTSEDIFAEECGDKSCIDGECTNCISQAYKQCVVGNSGDVSSFWFDSCGNNEGLYEWCGDNCQEGECVDTPYDPCSPKYDHTICSGGDVYWADACNKINDVAEWCIGSSICKKGKCMCTDTDTDCVVGICKKSTGECLPEPSPLCTGASCVPVGIYVYDNGSETDDSFGLEIKDAFYGETPSGGGNEWTIPMVDGQTYEMLLYGVGVPDGIGTYAIELTNAVKVDGPSLSGSDLDDGMSFVWHIKAKK